jgi:preprotein translocase subunit SecE
MLRMARVAKTSPVEFANQVRAEARKIVWPTRRETIMTGVMVMIMTSLLGLFFLGVDAFFDAVVRFLLSLASRG